MARKTKDVVREDLAQRVKVSVNETTHGRIADLDVEESAGEVILRGRAASQHLRQLALHAALRALSDTGECVRTRITVA